MARFVQDGDGAITIDLAPPLAVEVCASNIIRFRVEGKNLTPEASYFDARTWPTVSQPIACDALIMDMAAIHTTPALRPHLAEASVKI